MSNMYAFFIDDWTAQKKYRRESDGLDLLLTQHNLLGRRIKLGRLHDLDASVKECLQAGLTTLAAVGNDATISKLVNSLLKLDFSLTKKAALAILPIGRQQLVAQSFGCANLTAAVRALVLNQRAAIDLGKLNNRHYFITAAIFPPRVTLEFLSYLVSSSHQEHQVSICNTNIFRARPLSETKKGFSPYDGALEAVVSRRPESSFWTKIFSRGRAWSDGVIESIFPHQHKITVLAKTKTLSVQADTEKRLSTPVVVEVVPKALRVVVGAAKIF